MNKRDRSAESGSVIIWIFIGVAMFAALTFAASNINRSGDASNMKERDSIFATDLMQYSGAVQRGIRVMRINGIDETDLCFHVANWGHTDYEFNPECTSNSNRIFSAEGGSIGFQETSIRWYDTVGTQPPNDASDWVFSSNYEVTDVGVAGRADLLMATAPIRPDVCEAINDMLSFVPPTPPAAAAGVYNDLATDAFSGTYNDGGGALGAFGRERCVTDASGFNFYYKVILAR